jgi:hypothetical protein
MDAPGDAPFEPYLPRLVRDWAARTPAETRRELDGSLVSVDLSGFTALAERLRQRVEPAPRSWCWRSAAFSKA